MKKIKLETVLTVTLAYGIGLAAPPAAWAALAPPVPINTTNNISLDTPGNGIITNKLWAVVLGKALFWDMQAGSDNQACASCHFSAGADSRIHNQLSPGFLQKPTEDTRFGSIITYDGEIISGAQPGLTKSQIENGNLSSLDATYRLLEDDFPLHHILDYKDRNSAILISTNDVVSSSGAYDSVFGKIKSKTDIEKCKKPDNNLFYAGKYAARQVEPRNTPTTINAAFNFLNFADGRANHNFNGVDPFGKRTLAPSGDPNKRLVVLDDNGIPTLGSLSVENASLASQAVGPPLSALEMSCSDKSFPDLGQKMLSTTIRPLQLQTIDPNDSVFGANGPVGNVIHSSGKGLALSYAELIKLAFEDDYWKADKRYKIDNGQLQVKSSGANKGYYTQIENNFSMFWGLAIQMYEATLVSSQTPFDTWFAQCRPIVTNPLGATSQAVPIANPIVQCRAANSLVADPSIDPATLVPGFGATEVLGFGLFNNGGVGIRNAGSPACGGCHPVTSTNFISASAPGFLFPVFSEAQFQAGQFFVPVERSRIDDRGPGTPVAIEGAVHDRGFFNIGVRPTAFDPGIGGADPYGSPLSLARMFISEQAGETVTDPSGVLTSTGTLTTRCNTNTLIEGGGTPIFPGCPSASPQLLDKSQERDLVDGGFKTPTIRNIALTPPYFHNGGYSNLRQVVEFYARGGSRRDKNLIVNSYTGDTSGTGTLGKDPIPVTGPDFGTNVDFFIRDIKSTDQQIDAIVAFMKTLTDENVRCDAGVFDHPELFVFNGHNALDDNHDKRADDIVAKVSAVGVGGYAAAGRSDLCLPNTGDLFDDNLRNRLAP
jgi:cytochrome c peroxidase